MLVLGLWPVAGLMWGAAHLQSGVALLLEVLHQVGHDRLAAVNASLCANLYPARAVQRTVLAPNTLHWMDGSCKDARLIFCAAVECCYSHGQHSTLSIGCRAASEAQVARTPPTPRPLMHHQSQQLH